jgi:AAA+ ATPase superfamily predicted ATPase
MLDLQKARAPLYGRIDRRLHVRPFAYPEAALFTPGLTPTELATVYGTLGGMPVYLSRWDVGRGRDANLRRLFGDASSPLVEEGEFVLTSELPEAAGYFRIMHGIASGHRTFKALRDFAAIDIKRQLDRLIELGLVVREVPITEDPLRSKRVMYRVGDNFLDFWFRFVFRHRADIARGLGREVVDRRILPRMSHSMGESWEEMCREFVRRQAAKGSLPVPVSSVGRWWNRDNSVEIDVVGLDDRTVVLAGSVKWSRSVGRTDLKRLQSAVEALPDRADRIQLALFARESARDIGPGEALAFTGTDLYRMP